MFAGRSIGEHSTQFGARPRWLMLQTFNPYGLPASFRGCPTPHFHTDEESRLDCTLMPSFLSVFHRCSSVAKNRSRENKKLRSCHAGGSHV